MVSYQPTFSLRALTFSMLCLATGHTFAGGLDLPTITASHQGTSNANGAEANDPSVLYYNPAGLARLKGGLQVSQGFSLLALRGKVDVDENGTTGTPEFNETTSSRKLSDEEPTNGTPGTFWPSVLAAGGAFAALPIDDIVTAGVGIFAPGGGNLNYKADWAGAYQIDSIAIELININPSIGIRFDDKHSLGFGVSVIGGHIRQRTQIDVEGVGPYLLRNAAETGAIPVPAAVSALIPAFCRVPVITPVNEAVCRAAFAAAPSLLVDTENSSGSAKVEMYGYGLGFNVGYMFAVNDKTRMGLAYRSESTVKFRGKLEWDLDGLKGTALSDAALGPLDKYLRENLRPDTTAKGDLILPARTSANIFHKLNEKIDLVADFTFIETSAVDKIRVEFLDKKRADGTPIKQGAGGIDTKWKDSFKFSIGGNYHYDDKLTLKSGFQFDKTPVPSAEFRHPGAPDSDRYMYSVGANYKLKKNLTVDAAYSLTMLADSESNYRDACRVTTRDNADGTYNPDGEPCTGNGGTFKGRFYDTSIQTLSLQLNQKF
ncbi:MAG: outer membrane protein transport protein [Pseudomonadota bacterium]